MVHMGATLVDLASALEKRDATLKVELKSFDVCTITIDWATRKVTVASGGVSLNEPPEPPRMRTLGFSGSMSDAIDMLTAWVGEELPVTFSSAKKAES